MNIIPTVPPRKFEVGYSEHRSVIKDCAHIELDTDEQVTFTAITGPAEYDIVRKDWGFYATPSLNSRLLKYHLHAVLCKNRDGLYYILLVEEGKQDSFCDYVRLEKMDLVAWLDNPENFQSIEGTCMNPESARCCPICGNSGFKEIFHFTSPPPSEMRFDFSSHNNYSRKILQCVSCGHFVSVHEMDDSSLYSGDYVNANYRDENGIRQSFEKIMNLHPEKSDNAGRVKNILNFTHHYFSGRITPSRVHSVLDVGSGLCVFLAKMKEAGWNCTAIDPDNRAITHAVKNVGVRGICGDFLSTESGEKFDLITFNRVLEHVTAPEKMLSKSIQNISDEGIIYIEVPDGECAALDGKDREEFTIDHHHIFSFFSLLLLVKNAGLTPIKIERLREPSTKYTLRAFAIIPEKTNVPK